MHAPLARAGSMGLPAAHPWSRGALGRYEHVGAHPPPRIDTHAYDHRGNGASDGRKGDIDRWSAYHDDLEDRLAAAGRRPMLAPWRCTPTRWAGSSQRDTLDDRPRPTSQCSRGPDHTTLAPWKVALHRLWGRSSPRLPPPERGPSGDPVT